MKRIIIYISLITTIGLTSCEKWLTVEPATQTTEDKLFQSQQGFSDALIGLYLSLRSNYAPAEFMMGAGIDHMACLYTIGKTALDYQFYTHDYSHSNIDSKLGTAFLTNYKVVANANILLQALETQQILQDDIARLIEGEARAIRAFAHFDLIRTWGPIPSKTDNKTYLPYVLSKQAEPYDYDTYDRYMQLLLEDLDKAEELLQSSDPILSYSNDELNSSSISDISELNDLIWYYRQNRFNYYAVLALKARYFLWMGDTEAASNMAKQVVDALNSDGSNKFEFADPSIFSQNSDYTMFEEQIFGLNIQEYTDSYFSGSYAQYTNTVENINTVLFDPSSSAQDVRYKTFFVGNNPLSDDSFMATLKFSNMDLTTNSGSFSIPIMRISEMYLILAEAAPLSEANAYYKTYLEAKGLPPVDLEEATRKEVILKDYLKEFYSEGQAFFAYKRNFSSTMLFSSETMTEASYVPTLPSEELNPLQ